MRKISISRRKGQQGNSLLEFALFSTVLLMMTLGVTDLGRVFNIGNTALNAAEYAAKWGALSPVNYSAVVQEIHDRAMENMTGYPGAASTSSTTCRCGFDGALVDCATECDVNHPKATYIQVDTTIPFRSISGLPWVPVTTIHGRYIQRVE